jgi:hypothetical protein
MRDLLYFSHSIGDKKDEEHILEGRPCLLVLQHFFVHALELRIRLVGNE